MLVLVDEPQVDFLVKITGAHGGDAARAFTLRRDGAGQWTEREAFDDVDALPHLAEVDLSHPDRISIVVRTDREYRLEAERRQGQLFTGNETSDLGRRPFTVLALDRAGAEKVRSDGGRRVPGGTPCSGSSRLAAPSAGSSPGRTTGRATRGRAQCSAPSGPRWT